VIPFADLIHVARNSLTQDDVGTPMSTRTLGKAEPKREMRNLQNGFVETKPQLLSGVEFLGISRQALAAALGHLGNDFEKLTQDHKSRTLTLPSTPFSLMNLIKKLIFSLRLFNCTVKSLFGRMTPLSTLHEPPLNKALGKRRT